MCTRMRSIAPGTARPVCGRQGDMFEGYYKSKVVCPECQRVSVTFDPYMSVTLPLGAQDNSRGLVVSIRTLDGALSKLSLTLNASGKIEALLAAVSKQARAARACARVRRNWGVCAGDAAGRRGALGPVSAVD